MNSIYTTTITSEARRRGIRVEVLDERLPVFLLVKGRKRVRCFNALTDQVGAASFIMAQNKSSANSFLCKHGVPVPRQEPYTEMKRAVSFMKACKSIVVKPATQWGGRGVSVAVRTDAELTEALRRARHYEEDVLLEECVSGVDYRLIFVNYRYVAAIKRTPACVVGDGRRTIRALISLFNRRERKIDPSHQIPLDRESVRALDFVGMHMLQVPERGQVVRVRMNSNYHTGGAVEVVTRVVPPRLVKEGRKIAKLLAIPVVGIDFLYDEGREKYWVVELSPDLAISPPEGEAVAKRFLDYLFPS